jgi:hypothetical protein
MEGGGKRARKTMEGVVRSQPRLPPRDRFDGNKASSCSPDHAAGGRLGKNVGSSKPRAGGVACRSLAAAEGAGRWRVGF